MQMGFITKKIVGRRLPQSCTVFKTKGEYVKTKEDLRERRIIREIVYFKSKSKAEEFVASIKSPDYCGKIFIEKRILKYAVYHYRKY